MCSAIGLAFMAREQAYPLPEKRLDKRSIDEGNIYTYEDLVDVLTEKTYAELSSL